MITASSTAGERVTDAPQAPARSLRIAYVTETYPPEINGVANTVQRAVQWLAGRGHAVQLVRPRQPEDGDGEPLRSPTDCAPSELLTPGMPIPMYRDLRMGFARPARLAQAWRRARPDLVHIATEGPLGWAALRAAHRLGIPASSDFRTNFHLYSAHYGLGMVQPAALAYLRWFHNRAQLTTVPTRALRALLDNAGFHNLVVVGRGVDTRLFSPARRSTPQRSIWGASPDDVVVLYAGRLAPEKNVGLVLDAYQAMHAAAKRTRLVLVGDGPQRAALARRVPHAVFAGWQRGEDLARCYASADVFLFPSMTETFGNVVVEALASGLAVVAFDHGAAGEHMRDGVDGRLAQPGHGEQFVQRAVGVAVEAALRGRLQAGARRTAMTLSWDGIFGQLEQALIETARPARRTSPAQTVAAR
jgi:glycosyltransferase involved in cell wall biosynthesis